MGTQDDFNARIEGLDPWARQQAEALVAASGGRIYIESGFRDNAHQTDLWNKKLAECGGDEACARHMVAPPGTSNHETGLAIDFGGDMALLAQLGPQFGLVQPMDWEDWHWEPASVRPNSQPEAYTTAPNGHPPAQSRPNRLADNLANFSTAMASAVSADTAAMSAVAGGLVSPTPGENEAAKVTKAAARSAAAGGGTATAGEFATDILNGLGAPITDENIRAMNAWVQGEGTQAAHNPLATTQGWDGTTDFNSVGVKNYGSYDDGIAATLQTLNNGRYQPILDAFASGGDAMAVGRAIENSPWGTGGLVTTILGG